MAGEMRLIGNTLVAPAIGIVGRLGSAIRVVDESPGNALALANTIVSGTCSFSSGARQLAAAYNNIEAPGNGCRFSSALFNAQNQASATSAQIDLGPLADKGGPTWTRLPGTGSIAIDQGREANCSATDQRHYARVDAWSGIGAVEVDATPDALFDNGFD